MAKIKRKDKFLNPFNEHFISGHIFIIKQQYFWGDIPHIGSGPKTIFYAYFRLGKIK